MLKRKCCGTPRGKGPHTKECPQGKPSLRNVLDRDGVDLETRKKIVQDIGGDLPDGAFFELGREFGVEPEDWL